MSLTKVVSLPVKDECIMMFPRYIIICTIHLNKHEPADCLLCQANNPEEYSIIKSKVAELQHAGLAHCMEFFSEEQANKAMDAYLLKITKKYTKQILKEGVPPNIPVNCRCIIAFLSYHLVGKPGYYKVPLNLYVNLRNVYGNLHISLPSWDMIDRIDYQQLRDIPLARF